MQAASDKLNDRKMAPLINELQSRSLFAIGPRDVQTLAAVRASDERLQDNGARTVCLAQIEGFSPIAWLTDAGAIPRVGTRQRAKDDCCDSLRWVRLR